MSFQIYESDSKALALETEIRKLKLDILKQELDDKLLTLKNYLEKRKLLNETLTSTSLPSVKLTDSTNDNLDTTKNFGSILFVNLIGNFEVWHFVLTALILWFLLLILIGYVRRIMINHREKYRRKLIQNIKKKEKEKKINDEKTFTINNLKINNSIEKNKNLISIQQARVDLKNNQSTKTPIDSTIMTNNIAKSYPNYAFNELSELSSFTMPRKNFYLYTINENEAVANNNNNNNNNNVRQVMTQNQIRKMSSNLALSNKLSKSDTNLSQFKP